MRYIQLSSIENDYNKINKKLYKDEQLNVKERDIEITNFSSFNGDRN